MGGIVLETVKRTLMRSELYKKGLCYERAPSGRLAGARC